jgi:hypothetical protein
MVTFEVSMCPFGERLALFALCAAGAACAGAKAKPDLPASRPRPVVAGTWQGVFQATVREGAGAGDTRIERQAWRLNQVGDAVDGFYVVELTMISGDGRPYLCSREPRFSTLLRFDVRGRIDPEGVVHLEEIGDVKARGACRPTFRTPSQYRASVEGDVLTLSDGQRRMPLYRQRSTDKQLEGGLLAFDAVEPGPAAETSTPTLEVVARASDANDPPANIEGLWTWEHRGPLPSGDEKVEREEWHLVQEGTTITGYYDRAVHQISTDGHAYRCSSALDFRVTTRYQITGEVRGSTVVLFERAFEIIEGSPCDDGRRRLDAYQGQAAAGEIRLMWGVGTQVLRRARPNVPTQRF